jgi:hypothetical protein
MAARAVCPEQKARYDGKVVPVANHRRDDHSCFDHVGELPREMAEEFDREAPDQGVGAVSS